MITATAGLAPIVAAVDSWPAAVVVVAVLLAPTVATYVQGRKTKALAAQAAADAAQTREQTVNEHENHPTPNLREQMDAQDERLERIAELLSEHVAQDAAWKTSVEATLTRLHRPLFAWRR